MEWLLQPLSLVCLLLAFCAMCAFLTKGFYLGLLNLLSFTLLWALSTPELANRWIQQLESTRNNPSICSGAELNHIVVLGGGMNPWIPNSTARQRLNQDSIERALAAAKIGGSNTLWYTQGAGANGYTLADDMADILINNGVKDAAIKRERTSTSTQQNAANLNDFLPANESPIIHLVTSALHVDRAAELYNAQGYTVCHVEGVHSRYSIPAPPVSLLPYLSGFEKTTVAWREQLARIKRSLLN